MILSRRSFLLGTVSLGAIQVALPANAGFRLHGSSAPSANLSRVTVNAVGGYLNIAKGWQLPAVDPTTVSSDGYPLSAPSVSAVGSMPFPSSYYGQYVWKWSGTASMLMGGPIAIIYSGGTSVGLGTSSGQVTADLGMISQANPRVVFKFGALISAISGGGGSTVIVTTSSSLNFGSGISTGTNILLGTGVASILSSGPNSDGSWTITNVNGTQFTLNNSSGLRAITSADYNNSGTVGTNSEALITVNTNPSIPNSGTFSSWSGLVICKASDEATITAGQIVDSTLISQYQQLKGTPGGTGRAGDFWLRFMDLSGVQSSYECDFSQRIPSTNISYQPANYRPGYWTPSTSGTITNSSDAYTCADPSVSVWNGSSYVDNAIVQGVPSATNSTGAPTLNVGGHGAKPIFDTGPSGIIVNVTAAAASAGLSMVFSFQASWLNGGTPVSLTYTTVSGDTGAQVNGTFPLQNNLAAFFVANAPGSIQTWNSGLLSLHPRTAQAGRLTVTYTSGPAICNICSMLPSAITSGSGGTFVYSYLFDGWTYRAGGLICSVPLEAIVDMCNRSGACCWFNWGITKGPYVTAVANFMAANLSAGLKFGTEVGNEMWNSSASPFLQYNFLGMALGFTNGSDNAVYSLTALRVIQLAALSKAAWTAAGRASGDHYILQPSATFDVGVGSNFDVAQLKGAALVTTNTIYATYGGLNGSGTSPSYNVSPNRPVDTTDAAGCAPYWGSPWWGGQASGQGGITGAVTDNIPWLQAGKDFTNGLTATAFASLVNQFNGTTLRSGSEVGSTLAGYYGGANGGFGVFARQEAMCAQYDSGRTTPLKILSYEGGPQWAMGANFNNGVNSVNSTDINALANQMTSLGWNVSAYTVSGTNNATEAATQVITMIQAWKFDVSYKSLIEVFYYQKLASVSGSNRETHAAQYGYSASQWGLFPGNYSAGNQYKNFDAIAESNT